MALTLSKTNMVDGNTIEPSDVSQSIDAFTGVTAYTIKVSGSFILTGSQHVTGSISASLGTNTIGFHGTSSWGFFASQSISSSYALNSTNLNNQASSYYVNASNLSTGTLNNVLLPSQINVTGISASFTGSLLGIATSASMVVNGSTTNLDYGLFVNQNTQTLPAHLSSSISFPTTITSSGISLGITNDEINVTKTGIYNIQYTLQLTNTSGNNIDVYVWFRELASNISDSSKVYGVPNNIPLLISGNWLKQLDIGSTYQLWWYTSTSSNVEITAITSMPPSADVPSSTLQITQLKSL